MCACVLCCLFWFINHLAEEERDSSFALCVSIYRHVVGWSVICDCIFTYILTPKFIFCLRCLALVHFRWPEQKHNYTCLYTLFQYVCFWYITVDKNKRMLYTYVYTLLPYVWFWYIAVDQNKGLIWAMVVGSLTLCGLLVSKMMLKSYAFYCAKFPTCPINWREMNHSTAFWYLLVTSHINNTVAAVW